MSLHAVQPAQGGTGQGSAPGIVNGGIVCQVVCMSVRPFVCVCRVRGWSIHRGYWTPAQGWKTSDVMGEMKVGALVGVCAAPAGPGLLGEGKRAWRYEEGLCPSVARVALHLQDHVFEACDLHLHEQAVR